MPMTVTPKSLGKTGVICEEEPNFASEAPTGQVSVFDSDRNFSASPP
jgi:hypothetical protein